MGCRAVGEIQTHWHNVKGLCLFCSCGLNCSPTPQEREGLSLAFSPEAPTTTPFPAPAHQPWGRGRENGDFPSPSFRERQSAGDCRFLPSAAGRMQTSEGGYRCCLYPVS